MGSRPASPFGPMDKAPPEPPRCFILEDLDSPHPHKQETRGLDTIQATSFFPWWLLLFFQKKNAEANRDLSKIPEIRKNPKKSQVCETDRITLTLSLAPQK